MHAKLVFLLLLAASTLHAADLRGRVVNQSTGEPLAKVSVSLSETKYSSTTGADGAFTLPQVPAGKYTLTIHVVGFWIQRFPVEVTESEAKDFQILLTPQGARRTDKVEVTADVFGGSEPAEVGQLNITTSELKQSDTVFAGDLFRSVQTMPGVTGVANNDFFSQFMVLGAPFSSVGVYVDDVLVRQPFHGISDNSEGASIGVMNDDIIATLSLTPLGYSEKYADATGGALSIRTREGSRDRTRLGVGIGMAESHVTAEGALPANRGSWLASARKSYLGYLTRHSVGDTTTVEPSFSDLSTRITYDLTAHQTLDLMALGGRSQIDNSETRQMNPNEFFTGSSNFSLLRLGWRAGLTKNLLLSMHAAFTSQSERTKNQGAGPINKRNSSEWATGSAVSWEWRPKQTVEAAWTVRRLSRRSATHYYSNDPRYTDWDSDSSGTGMRQGGFAQQSSTLMRGRMQVMGGVRWDQFSKAGIHPLSPQVSGSFRIASATNVVWAAGRYRQFPDVDSATRMCGGFGPLVASSDHYLAGIEQRIGDNARFRVQAFDRTDHVEFGTRGGRAAWDAARAGTPLNSCGGIVPDDQYPSGPKEKTRGTQIIVQRRSSNRVSGWLSYTRLLQRETQYGWYATGPDEIRHPYSITVPGNGDQKNALNAFGMYRITPTLNFSGKFLYGSGFPLGFGGLAEKVYVDGQLVDRVRTDPFLRLDLRVDKAFTVHGRRVTLHGEVLNITNHKNVRLFGYQLQSVDGKWDSFLTEGRALGFTPTVGIDIQF